MTNWRSYTQERENHTIVGELLITDRVYSPQLHNHRNLLVWLPPSYRDNDRRFPVIYMHDGDNLFDENATPYGEWQVDETLTQLAEDGMEAIVVGIPNMAEMRFSEYCPFDEVKPALGDAYLRFIVDTIKPMIDADFRTQREAASAAIFGSSMGGLISLYGFLKYPNVFGLCGAFSPVFWFNGDALYQTVLAEAIGNGRVYLDVGTKEGEVYGALVSHGPISDDAAHDAYRDGVRHLRDGLLHKGYARNLLYVEDEDALHNESAWAKRLPGAFRFLLAP